MRLDPEVLEWLPSKGEGHLTRINDILANFDGSGAADWEREVARPGLKIERCAVAVLAGSSIPRSPEARDRGHPPISGFRER
jgi:BrnA antitoxin of type II toxin-antitoxin system